MTNDEDHPPLYPEGGSLADDLANIQNTVNVQPDDLQAVLGTLVDYANDDLQVLEAAEPITISCRRDELNSGLNVNYYLRRRKHMRYTEHPLTSSFFQAIAQGQDDLINTLITMGFVSVKTLDVIGRTPVMAAVESGNVAIVQQLMDFDADVNALSSVSDAEGKWLTFRLSGDSFCYLSNVDFSNKHTPLMKAAAMGHLPLVKLLMEVYHADDSVIGNDGQTALRLAAVNGHKEIVDYLPATRGGGFKRWKWKNKKAVRRIKAAAYGVFYYVRVVVFDIPRFFIWSLPKHLIILPIRDASKWLHKNRTRLGSIFVNWIKKTVIRTYKTAIKIPKALWNFTKFMFKEVLWSLTKWIWRILTIKLPLMLKTLWNGFVKFLKLSWNNITHFIGRVVSAFHTVILKLSMLIKNLTWADVFRGFQNIFHWIFVLLPQQIVKGVQYAWQAILSGIENLFESWIMKELASCLMHVIMFIPTQLWKIMKNCGDIVGRGMHEIHVFFNPKTL